MATEIKLWQIEDDKPKPVDPDKLDLEARLEKWIHEDISLVSDDLLVIGQQVSTGYNGIIDLLAMDSDANLVILELKRDKTPRDVVAQALDYASWVQSLDYDKVVGIASYNFKDRKNFENAFKEKFGDDLPEVINGHHRIYIVASSLDSSTERIIEYLSEIHGVDINAATFAYFNTENMEWLGRSMLLDEEEVERRTEARTYRPNPTLDEFRAIAEENGVLNLWERAYKEFDSMSRGTFRKKSSLHFRVRIDGSIRWFLQIYPKDSSEENGLLIRIDKKRVSQYFSLSVNQIQEVFGSSDWNSFDADRLDRLIKLLRVNAP